tara:strand:- start:211 stop:345 length:135 start_codon:yes stop_codon:yes gene_type:complete
MEDDEATITGMDCDVTWMYVRDATKQNIGESTKDKKVIDKPIKK